MEGIDLSLNDEMIDYQTILNRILPEGFTEWPIDQQRQAYLQTFLEFPSVTPESVRVIETNFFRLGREIPARIYYPSGNNKKPCIVYCHGGGFTLGGLDTHGTIAADIAYNTNTVVVLFEFGKAPEYTFPVPVEDCYSVYIEISKNADVLNIDRNRIAIGGDSCGGVLSAAVSLLVRDRGGPTIWAQLPINPVFDAHKWANGIFPNISQVYLTEMRFYNSQFLGNWRYMENKYASPLRETNFSHMPQALIWVADPDPMGFESSVFQCKMDEYGIPCELNVGKGFVHGCFRSRHTYKSVAQVFNEHCHKIKELMYS
jgi:acetyl esterase